MTLQIAKRILLIPVARTIIDRERLGCSDVALQVSLDKLNQLIEFVIPKDRGETLQRDDRFHPFVVTRFFGALHNLQTRRWIVGPPLHVKRRSPQTFKFLETVANLVEEILPVCLSLIH